MAPKEERPTPLEQGLLNAMKALDNQIAREMQRSPAETDKHGVQKWEPYQKRIESVSAFVMNALGGQEVDLDSLLVLAQAMTKCLQLVVEELGQDGLGQVRSSYCQIAMENISKDAYRAGQILKGGNEMM
jgi:hypothetical protein